MNISVTGKGLDIKRLAPYLRKSQKTCDIYTQMQGETLFITNGFLFARLPPTSELTAWIPKAQQQTIKYTAQTTQPVPVEHNYAAAWDRLIRQEAIASLTPTRLLYEDTAGVLYRKFSHTNQEQEQAVWIAKTLTDLFASDPDDWYGYLVELISNDTVRVGAYNGWCACVISNSKIKA